MASPGPDASRPYGRYRKTRGARLVLPAEGCSLPSPSTSASTQRPLAGGSWPMSWRPASPTTH